MPGYQDSLTQVYVEPNVETKFRITLNPITTGTFEISTVPSGAAVTINGSSYGITPVTVPDLENGSYIVGFTLSGYQEVQNQIILGAGQHVPVSATLQPIPTATPTPVLTTPMPTATPTPTPTQASLSSVVILIGLLIAVALVTKKN